MAAPPFSFETPADILDVALSLEKRAYDFYTEALRHITVDPMRQLLEQLRDAEYQHVNTVEKMIERMRLG